MDPTMTRRDLGRLAAGGAGAALLGHVPGLSAALASDVDVITAPIAWTSDDPHLSGNFAPIGPEIEAADLEVVAGRIPADLSGAYMRNGPNPLFKPISFTYPLDGDGMVHAVYLDNGRARYKNRFVRTAGLEAERRAGRALYGGVMRPVPVDPKLVGPDGDPGPIKNGSFISVLRHGGHLLALNEASPCYELSMELETLGQWTAGTAAPIELGAHNRHHPQSGALFTLAYEVEKPLVHFHRIAADGTLADTFTVTLDKPTMIHDFVLTENHIVLLAGPAVFDLEAAMRGESMLQWQPDLGMRIALIALDGSTVDWLETDAFFVFHFANGFERGGRIFIDYVRHSALHLGYRGATANEAPPRLHRLTIDPAARRVTDAEIAPMTVEFPRVNDAYDALPTRYVYIPTITDTLKLPDPPSASFNTICRVDTDTGDVLRHDFGNRLGGEPVFIPRPGGTGEGDGYLAVFAYDPATETSDFVLLDAAHVNADPVAVIRLPQRVPQGLHGTWIPKG